MNLKFYNWLEPDIEITESSIPLKIIDSGFYKTSNKTITSVNNPKGLDNYILIYIAYGKGYFIIKDNEIVIPKGSIVLFKPKEPHAYHFTPEHISNIYWVTFNGSRVHEYLDYYEIPNNSNTFYVGTSSIMQLIFNQMSEEITTKNPNHEALLRLLLQQLLLLMNRSLKDKDTLLAEEANEIESAIHYFNINYNKPITIEEYTSNHSISENWFINRFKNSMKVTPMQYILQLRIQAAKTYLENTDKNITEIANAVGYDNPLYFSRLFKKNTGLSPKEYRKKISSKLV